MSATILTKRCSRCKKTKAISDFYRSSPRYHQCWCKVCRAIYKAQPAVKSRERARRQQPEAKAVELKYRQKPGVRARHAESVHRCRLKNNYKLTVEEYEAMLRVQDGRCAICNAVFPKGRRPHVDHDHATGKVRGLLCARHNHGLGMFSDSEELLMAAAAYLQRFRETQ